MQDKFQRETQRREIRTHEAKIKIRSTFPDLDIKTIRFLAEGVDNEVYEVNGGLVFRFPKTRENKRELAHEAHALALLDRKVFPEIPAVLYWDETATIMGQKMAKGVSADHLKLTDEGIKSIGSQLGLFLRRLHSVPLEGVQSSGVEPFRESPQKIKALYRKRLVEVQEEVPDELRGQLETLLEKEVSEPKRLVLGHNDLRSDHIFLEDGNVTGIIDWGGIGISDPAFDFGRIYKSFGEPGLDAALESYGEDDDELRERSIYYGVISSISSVVRAKRAGDRDRLAGKVENLAKIVQRYNGISNSFE